MDDENRGETGGEGPQLCGGLCPRAYLHEVEGDTDP